MVKVIPKTFPDGPVGLLGYTTVRIIAGLYRGRTILAPPGRTTRPITDRVKESLFAILGDRVDGAAVADLFAGTGSLGLEALSRHAQFCLFIESDRQALRLLKQNARSLSLQEKCQIINKNAWQFGQRVRPAKSFDLVFVDPPYLDSRCSAPETCLGKLLARMTQHGLLADRGTVVLRHESAYPREHRYGNLTLQDSRRYGAMALSLLVRQEGADQ